MNALLITALAAMATVQPPAAPPPAPMPTGVLATSAATPRAPGPCVGICAMIEEARRDEGKVRASQEGPDCTILRPDPFGRTRTPYPVILWGNGTRSQVPAYLPMLRRWASAGFVVAAANTNTAGSGAPLLACLDYLTAESSRTGSSFKGKIDLNRVGASGHSQGGGGAIMAGRDPRIKTTAPIEPYTQGLGYVKGAEGQQKGPMLLLSGGADTTAGRETNQAMVFKGANAPVYWLTIGDATHAAPATADQQPFLSLTTLWFKYQLKGDLRASKFFLAPDSTDLLGAAKLDTTVNVGGKAVPHLTVERKGTW